MDITMIKKAYEDLPDDNNFYSKMDGWIAIYNGNPAWKDVKKSGLLSSKKKNRPMNRLNVAKILCDEFAHKIFGEQVEITLGNEEYEEYIKNFLNREGFWKNIPLMLSKAFSEGGFVIREYIDDGKVKLNYIEGKAFYPTEWDNKNILGGVFVDKQVIDKNYFTQFERHTFKNGEVKVEHKLFKSQSADSLGNEIDVSTLYDFDDVPPINTPLFQYFKPDISNNQQTDLPLGISVYANSEDTLKALDVAFDSFAREFVLGKKRIIVPSSCIRTVVDTETGNVQKYFDSDDEVYQALACDEDKNLNIQDNTIELRINEHVDGINALLNILCFQVGLSAGSLSFDTAQGMKTATEVVSMESKTALTIKCNKNLLVEMIEGMVNAVLHLAMETGEIHRGEYDLAVKFPDTIITDENTKIDNNIKLVSAGLKSKVTAMMEVLNCSEEDAKAELERINEENATVNDGGFNPDIQ